MQTFIAPKLDRSWTLEQNALKLEQNLKNAAK